MMISSDVFFAAVGIICTVLGVLFTVLKDREDKELRMGYPPPQKPSYHVYANDSYGFRHYDEKPEASFGMAFGDDYPPAMTPDNGIGPYRYYMGGFVLSLLGLLLLVIAR